MLMQRARKEECEHMYRLKRWRKLNASHVTVKTDASLQREGRKPLDVFAHIHLNIGLYVGKVSLLKYGQGGLRGELWIRKKNHMLEVTNMSTTKTVLICMTTSHPTPAAQNELSNSKAVPSGAGVLGSIETKGAIAYIIHNIILCTLKS